MDRTADTPSNVSRRSVLKRSVAVSVAGLAGVSAASGSAAAKRCDAVVPDDYTTIQAAVDDAADGDTICVEAGTYVEDVDVDTQVTLRGRTAPGSTNAATVDGQLTIEPGADGSAVRRLRIAPTETFAGGTFPDPAGVLVKASGVTVENTVIEDLHADLSDGGGSFALHGLQVFGEDGAAVSDVAIRNNVFRGFRSKGVPGDWPKYGGVVGVKAQAGVEAVTITGNHVADFHSAGWAWGIVLTSSASASGVPSEVTVSRNHVADLNDGSVYGVFAGPNDGRDEAPYPGSAFGIDGTADAAEATVEQNNLLAPNGAESKDEDGTLDAECNWWGDRSGPTHADNPDGEGTWALERGNAEIDYTPWSNAPVPSNACVGGTDRSRGS